MTIILFIIVVKSALQLMLKITRLSEMSILRVLEIGNNKIVGSDA